MIDIEWYCLFRVSASVVTRVRVRVRVVLNAECFKKYRNTKNKKKPFTLTLSCGADPGHWHMVRHGFAKRNPLLCIEEGGSC